MLKVSGLAAACAALTLLATPVVAGSATAGPTAKGKPATFPGGYKHLVVIYEENHSFDNLYGSWGSVNGQHVTGLADATDANTTQVDQHGAPYDCLLQDDVNLTSPDPLPTRCHDAHHVNATNATTGLGRLRQPLLQRALLDRRLHPARGPHLPRTRRCAHRPVASRRTPGVQARRLHP